MHELRSTPKGMERMMSDIRNKNKKIVLWNSLGNTKVEDIKT